MIGRFSIEDKPLPDLKLLTRKRLGDQRGYLERMFCRDEMAELLAGRMIAQINHTYTASKGTVRGLHFQYPPHAEMKLVSCLRGTVFDVAVDLRKRSPTFLSWHAELLSDDNEATFVIPEGFAHGFQTLSDNCEMLYLHTAAHAPASEAGLNPKDSSLGIKWPLAITDISDRDRAHSPISNGFEGISL